MGGVGGGGGDHKNLLMSFHLMITHHHHHSHGGGGGGGKKETCLAGAAAKDIPKGCMAIKVGQGDEQQRFIIPVMYVNHPLFMQLLKEAEEEYGFDQKGPITIPCHVEEFRHVQGIIDKEKTTAGHLHHPNHHHHHHHHLPCFRV